MSILCLGGGKMVDMPIEEGKELVKCAIDQGIFIFDTHHRYGNCETILSNFNHNTLIAKVSAYEKEDWYDNVKNSVRVLSNIDVFFVSDLDNNELYKKGEQYHGTLMRMKPACRIGVTSESPELIIKFKREHPECTNFMIPVYPGSGMNRSIIEELREQGQVFSIKPFDDGRAFADHGVKECLQYQKELEIDVVIFGTKSKEHLKEVVNIWNRLT